MDKLDHDIPAPAGWPTAFVNRELPALESYMLLVCGLSTLIIVMVCFRTGIQTWRLQRELKANPNDSSTIAKKMTKVTAKTDKVYFKIALAYMANTVLITLVDGFIAVFVLAKDVSDNPEAWDKNMIVAVALYVVYLLVLFAASFILVPLLQIILVTWALTRFSKKNTLSEYVPQARSLSTSIALLWTGFSFSLACSWPVVGESDSAATRFLVMQAFWGSALAWLEASFMFNYMGHAIGDKSLNRGNGVGETVALFAKAARTSFGKREGDLLPRYEDVAPDETVESEKQTLLPTVRCL